MTVYITRCPACQQAFKLTENVLQAKSGQVRCGFCQNVFNAREHLYKSINLEESLNRIEREAEVEQRGIASMKSLADQLKGFDSVDDNQGLVGIRSEVRNGPQRLDIINGGSNIQVISHPAAAPDSNHANDVINDDDEDEDNEDQTPVRSSKTILWTIVAVIAVLALAVKLLAANQNAVLNKIPQAEPLFELICGKISCEPRQTITPLDAPVKDTLQNNTGEAPDNGTNTSALTILSHKLQNVEGNRYAISVEIKNNTTVTQAFPILTVVLKGEKEDIITRRRITPSEYLADPKQSIAPSATQTVSIAFDMADGDPSTLAVEIDPIL